nr:hypothetical protein GCM10020093_016120 [Planobispora longispora]
MIALRDVSTRVDAGEVTCVLGDNGAGKSTLIKILAGVHPPDSGEYLVDGAPARFTSPRDALDRGIATVYQDLAMIPLMSVWRNFFLGSEPSRGRGPFRRFDVARAKRTVREELRSMGIDIRDVDQPVGTLSGGERQSVAIARAVYFGARVLILDEPTSALGVKQAGWCCATSPRPATAAWAWCSSRTTRTTPTRSATASCCSTGAPAWGVRQGGRHPSGDRLADGRGAELEQLAHELGRDEPGRDVTSRDEPGWDVTSQGGPGRAGT